MHFGTWVEGLGLLFVSKPKRIVVSDVGDALIAPDRNQKNLRGLKHEACNRKTKLSRIGLFGRLGHAIVCKKCALRIEVPAKVASVEHLRLHFIRFNL